MRGSGVLTAVAVVGAVSLAAVLARGQETEPKIVEINTLNVRDTVYNLSGNGSNTLALIDEFEEGVTLIDTKSPGWGQPVLDALEPVTFMPVTTVVVTSADPAHAGASAEFAGAPEIVAHENTAANLARAGGASATLPITTFSDRHTLLEGGPNRIDLYYFGAGHTDGDVLVVFPEKGLAYTGDLFPSKSAPVIDRNNGGSGLALPETLAKAVAGITGVRRVITGHTPLPSSYAGRGQRQESPRPQGTTWEDFEEYADFTRDLRAAVEAAHRAGKSVDDAVATLALPARYDDYEMDGARATVEAMYEELAARP
jgi:cyclase